MRTLYQVHTEPVKATADAEVTTVSKWYQPYSEPRRDKIAKAFAVALIASGGVINPLPLPDPEPVTESRWHQAWSEPVRVKRGLNASQQQTLAVPVLVPAPEVITLDKWFNPLAQPTIRPRQTADLIAFVPLESFKQGGWQQPFSEPIRIKRQVDSPDLALVPVQPEVIIVPDIWYPPLADPVRYRNLHASLQQSESFAPVVSAPTPGTGDVLFSQSWTSVPSWVTLLYQSETKPVDTPAVPQDDVSVATWVQQFTLPPDGGFASIDTSATFMVEEAVQFGWYGSLSDPVRGKLGLHASRQQSSVFVPVVSAPTPGTGDVLFSQVDLVVNYQQTLLYQSVFQPVPIVSAEIVTADKWFVSLSEPIRSKPRLTTAAQQAAWLVSDIQPPTPGSGDVLFSQTETAVYFQKYTLYQSIAEPIEFTAPPPVAVEYGWFVPFSEPVRSKLGLTVAAQQAAWFVSEVPAPTPGTGDVLFAQESTTVTYTHTFLYQSITQPIQDVSTPDVSVDSWFSNFSLPSDGGSMSIDLSATFMAVEHVYGWYSAFSEPIRYKSNLFTGHQQFTPPVSAPTPGSGDVLFSQTSTDIPQHISLLYQSIADPVRVEAPYVDPPMASWSYGWTGPVRLRSGLLAALQTETVMPIIPQPNPPGPTGQYTVSGLYVIDQFTDNTVVYNYSGGVSHRTN